MKSPVSEAGRRPGELPRALPGAFRFSEVAALGIAESRFRRWLADGLVERVGRGAYRRVGATMEDLDRLEVVLRAPRATICLISGLVEHDLVDDNPGMLDLALPRGVWQPKLASPVRWHSFATDTFDLDRSLIPTSGADHGAPIMIGLYGPRRCIVDVFRLRHDVGPEPGVEALRRWLRRPGNKPSELLSLARNFPAALPSLTAALRVLL